MQIDRRFALAALVAVSTLIVVYLLAGRGLMPGANGATLDSLAVRLLAAIVVAVASYGVYAGHLGGDDERRWVVLVGVLVAGALAYSIVQEVRTPVLVEGDAGEYLLMSASVADHGWPDVSERSISRFNHERVGRAMPLADPMYGFFRSPVDERTYSYHFWGYSAAAAPLWVAYDAVGVNPMKALSSLNLVLFFTALGGLLFCANLAPGVRAALTALLCFSPLVWYLRWPSPEVFSASLVILGIVFFTRGDNARSVLLVALASVQNPPLLLLAATIGARTLAVDSEYRSLRGLLSLGAAASVGLVPLVFYQVLFGTPNLIKAAGFSDASFLTMQRVWSIFFDLNQGMGPHVLILVVGLAAAVVLALRYRRWWTLARMAVLFVMILVVGMAIDWNNNSAGLMRYGTWMLPLIAWMVADAVAAADRRRLVVAALITVQFANCVLFFSIVGALDHNIIAREVLARTPRFYNPVPEVFFERTVHDQVPLEPFLPTAFAKGVSVTKVLVADDDRPALDNYLTAASGEPVDSSTAHPAGLKGLSYVEFAPGEVQLRTQSAAVAGASVELTSTIGGRSQYERVSDRFNQYAITPSGAVRQSPWATYPVYAEARNSGDRWWYPGGRELLLLLTVHDAEGREVTRTTESLRRATGPGESAAFHADYLTPAVPGSYTVRVGLAQSSPDGTSVRRVGRTVESPILVEWSPPLPEEALWEGTR